ncbi:MAG TPA: hypothetical protein VHP83_10600 [Aggregatilineaceae bacterium]|nr:hypothetical protein [Aggregatilineaceae bacterium]
MSDEYEIRLEGYLDAQWSQWFDGLVIHHCGHDETVLTGPIADQAALHGILAKIRDIGIPILALQRVHMPDAKAVPGEDRKLSG